MAIETARSLSIKGNSTKVEGDVTIRFNDLHKLYSGSEDGQELNSKVRWERYRPEGMTNGEWQCLLGFDVNNLDHNLLTYYQARVFIGYQNQSNDPKVEKLDHEEQKKLLLACLIHDWAEAKLGDLNQDYKTKTRQEIEMETLKEIACEFFGSNNRGFLDEVIDIIDNPNTKLGRMFDLNESLGYFKTATKAWKRSQGEMVKKHPYSDLPLRLKWLTSNVLGHKLIQLMESSHEFPFVKKCIEQNGSLIDNAFDTMPPQVFDFYEPGKKQENINRYERAKQKWTELQPPILVSNFPRRQNIAFLINRP